VTATVPPATSPLPADAGAWRQRSPYQGLAPYTEQDAPFFFGRDAEREIIIANLLASRLTVVYGTSGVGKTSVLRAGVAHRLRERAKRQQAEHDRAARAGEERDGAEFLVVVFDAWRDDPVAGLQAAVRHAATDLFGPSSQAAQASGGLAASLGAWTAERSCDLLIILDQFEEYFLYHAAEDGEGTFAVEFPRAVNDEGLPVSFLVSIREDALSRLDRFKGRIPGLLSNYLRVQHLDLRAARSAIEDPLREYNNRRTRGESSWTIEPELVSLVLEELQPGRVVLGATGQGAIGPGTEPDRQEQRVETPFLQLVMTQLWATEAAAGSHVLHAATLGRLGGAREIVRSHLDQAMGALGEDEQDAAAQIFHYLVTPSGTKIAYTAADLAGYAKLPEERIARLLEQLSLGDARAVRPVGPAPDGSGATRYEVFHDVLAPAVLDWRTRHGGEKQLHEARQRAHEARRRLRRVSLLAGALGTLLVAAIALGILAVSQRNQAEAQRRRSASYAMVANAEARFRDQPDLSILFSLAAYRLVPSDEARRNLQLQADRRRDASALLTGAAGVLLGATFSPDGRLLAASDAGGARLWKIATRETFLLPASTGRGRVRSLAFSPDGRLLAAGDAGGIRLWNLATRQAVLLPGGTGEVRSLAFSPDGKVIAAGDAHGMRLWNLATRRQPAVLAKGPGGADTVAFSQDGGTLAWSNADKGMIALWDTKQRRVRHLLPGHGDGVAAIALSPDGRTLVSAGSIDSTILIWHPAPGRLEPDPLTEEYNATTIAFSPDGRTLAVAGDTGATVELWDIQRRARARGLTGNTGSVTTVSFSPDGRTLAASSDDRTVALFDVPRQLPIGPTGFVNTLAFSPDGKTLASGGEDGNVVLWDVPTNTPRVTLRGHRDEVTGVAFTPDGRTLASAASGEKVLLWDVQQGKALPVPGFTTKGVFKMAFSPTQPFLALAGTKGTITLWDTRRWVRVAALPGHKGLVYSVAFSPDGRRLASGGADGRVVVWDVTSHARLTDLPAHSDVVNRVAFSPDGRALASGGDEGVAVVWDPDRYTVQKTFAGVNVAFSPDSRTLATLLPTGGGNVIWNVATGVAVGQLASGIGAAFSPDGRLLATAGNDVVLHDLDLAAWQRKLCALAGRDLTDEEWKRFASGVPKRTTCG
jgi:WD40 repeat protein